MGITQTLLGGAQKYLLTVGSETTAGGSAGYLNDFGIGPDFGSISPGKYRGADVMAIYTTFVTSEERDLVVNMSGARTQDFFTGIRLVSGNGAVRSFSTSSASFAASTNSLWRWGVGASNPVFGTSGDVDADDGEVKVVEIF